GTSYSSTGLTDSTLYRFRVRATDAAGNLSGYSGIAQATTPAVPDTQAPSDPSGLTATALGSSQSNLAWTGSTDNDGVTQYLVERCSGASCTTWAQVGTATATSFSSTGLAASSLYRFRVRATDAAGNFSGYSGIAEATPVLPPVAHPAWSAGGGS